jgi:membrane-associated phospholipid phosphatase
MKFKDRVKYIFLVLLIIGLDSELWSQTISEKQSENSEMDTKIVKDNIIPVSMFFHDIGGTMLRSVSYNYGMNFIAAGLVTWGLIASGADWQWRQIVYHNEGLTYAGIPSLHIGYSIPILLPLGLYTIGRCQQYKRMQIAGLALAQAAFLSSSVSVVLKGITGLKEPCLIEMVNHSRKNLNVNTSGKFMWGFGRYSFIKGWPSGHTINAVAAAAALSEIYSDSLALKICLWTYAAYIGWGVSVSVHWASEVFAGALMGYAIGKTVGRSFNILLKNNEAKKNNDMSFYVTPNSAGVIFSF